jgi:hypothetical protein
MRRGESRASLLHFQHRRVSSRVQTAYSVRDRQRRLLMARFASRPKSLPSTDSIPLQVSSQEGRSFPVPRSFPSKCLCLGGMACMHAATNKGKEVPETSTSSFRNDSHKINLSYLAQHLPPGEELPLLQRLGLSVHIQGFLFLTTACPTPIEAQTCPAVSQPPG